MPSQPQKNKHAVSTKAAILLIAVALLFDGVQAAIQYMNALPVVGTVAVIIFTTLLDVWAYLTIWFSFKLAAPGISFMQPKRALALNGGLLIEIIPIINALPAWTLAVVIIIITTRAEETLVQTLEKTAGVVGAAGKMANAASKIPGMNKNLKQGLEKTSEGAKTASEFAREKAGRMRTMAEQSHLGADVDTGEKTGAQKQAGQGTPATRPATPPAAKTPLPSQDIGQQPVFRQTPPNANGTQTPLQKAEFGQYKGYAPQLLSKGELAKRKGGGVARAMDEEMYRKQDERRGIKHVDGPTTEKEPTTPNGAQSIQGSPSQNR